MRGFSEFADLCRRLAGTSGRLDKRRLTAEYLRGLDAHEVAPAVDFHTHAAQRTALVTVLSTGSRGAARGIVEHVVTEWFDLNFLVAGQVPTKFISLFDDTEDVWAAEDFRLVEPLSTVAYWSRPDEFYGELVA